MGPPAVTSPRLAGPLPGTSVFMKTPLQNSTVCVVLNAGSGNTIRVASTEPGEVCGEAPAGRLHKLDGMPGIFGEQNLYLTVKQEITHLLVGLYYDWNSF